MAGGESDAVARAVTAIEARTAPIQQARQDVARAVAAAGTVVTQWRAVGRRTTSARMAAIQQQLTGVLQQADAAAGKLAAGAKKARTAPEADDTDQMATIVQSASTASATAAHQLTGCAAAVARMVPKAAAILKGSQQHLVGVLNAAHRSLGQAGAAVTGIDDTINESVAQIRRSGQLGTAQGGGKGNF